MLTFVLTFTLLAIGSVHCMSVNGTVAVNTPETVHVLLNGTFELDCDKLEAHVWTEPIVWNTTGNSTTEASATTALPSPNNYSLHLFKKDELVVQLYNSKLRVVASGVQNAGHYECGYYSLDKFGKLNYIFRKSWTVQITVPTVTTTTTTAVPVGEAVVAQESLTDSIDLDKRNINIFTYSNWALIIFLVTGFLVICAAFLVVILLFNVKTCRSCQRPRGKELL